MDISQHHYISPDNIRNIVQYISPKQIFEFCRVNKQSRQVCRSQNFWPIYINKNQRRYNKLILEIAKEGDLKLFTQLWTNLPSVISEPKLLFPAFEIAFTNGHEELAEHLHNLYFTWSEYVLDELKYEDKWRDSLNVIYQQWRSTDKILQENNNKGLYLHNFEIEKFKILLKNAVISDDLEYAENLIKDPKGISGFSNINNALSYANSIDSLKILIRLGKKYGYDATWTIIFENALKNSNYNILPDFNIYSRQTMFNLALEGNYQHSLRYARKNILPQAGNRYLHWPKLIGNKYVLYKILDGARYDNVLDNTDKQNNEMILESFAAFIKSPSEYVELIQEYMGCINNDEKRDLENSMMKKGEYYMAKVVDKNVAICDVIY